MVMEPPQTVDVDSAVKYPDGLHQSGGSGSSLAQKVDLVGQTEDVAHSRRVPVSCHRQCPPRVSAAVCSGACVGALCTFVSYLTAAGAGGGFDELVPVPKPSRPRCPAPRIP